MERLLPASELPFQKPVIMPAILVYDMEKRNYENVWYFAYGSNMSTEKFSVGRGIQPIDTARVYLPGWKVKMSIPGVPYSEPAFSSIWKPIAGDGEEDQVPVPDVVGVAYLVTPGQYSKIKASEGGGSAYADVALTAKPLTQEDMMQFGTQNEVRTLVGLMRRNPCARPSERYMVRFPVNVLVLKVPVTSLCKCLIDLDIGHKDRELPTYRPIQLRYCWQDIIRAGASEANLPQSYQAYLKTISTYQPPRGQRYRFGAFIFLAIWGPIMSLLEEIINATTDTDGLAPPLVHWLVRFTMSMIWLTHDLFLAPIFGRGDGINETSNQSPGHSKMSTLRGWDHENLC